MSGLKATPGPWQRSPSKESGGSFIEHISPEYISHVVAFVHASHDMFDPPIATEEDAANAHLIAAAPELYEALDKLKSSYEALAHDYEYAVGAGDIHPLHAEHIQRCAAVLAKARGEQP